ncbi:hypothetical protein AMECASPLE_003516 [Ameca splendens]|uniref:Uncharacterized protein n=1 Tax=Ameca splendens TaxID=208324 RepID=A0ABV1A5W1_9TELE
MRLTGCITMVTPMMAAYSYQRTPSNVIGSVKRCKVVTRSSRTTTATMVRTKKNGSSLTKRTPFTGTDQRGMGELIRLGQRLLDSMMDDDECFVTLSMFYATYSHRW